MSDQPQDVAEQVLWNRDLGHLEGHGAAVADHPGADLDELLPQAGERPAFHCLGQSQRPQEVAEIVGERVKLEPDGIGGEGAAGQPRPLQGVLALFDVLLGGAALIVPVFPR